MSGAVIMAVVAAVGNLLQGWDNASLSGSLSYLKKEFNFQTDPKLESLILVTSPIASTFVTTFCGPISDSFGRRPLLLASSICYLLSSLVMLWSPNFYVLLLGRLLVGSGVGLAVTVVPLYISETAPSETRGLLNTFPQFTGSGGMFLAYCMVFGMSLLQNLSWRMMLGFVGIPSLVYFALIVFFLPESPRWLVSKGRMAETKRVLQRLRGREDVTGEMALLVEGLDVGHETTLEEYIISPETELTESQDPSLPGQFKLYGPEEGLSWVARSLTSQTNHGSFRNPDIPLMDPLVKLIGSVHDKVTESEGMSSIIFSTLGSMFSTGDSHHAKNREWDEENVARCSDDDYASDYGEEEANFSDDNLQSPLIAVEKDAIAPAVHGTLWNISPSSFGDKLGIGGGWKLAWKWNDGEGARKGGFKRIYLHQEGEESKRGSVVSSTVTGENEPIKAFGLLSQPGLTSNGSVDQSLVGPAMARPCEGAAKGPAWSELMEPGVKRALVVGMGIQLLQQFSGINGVLYYTPQILEQAGVGVLLSNLGINPQSASFLSSAFTTFLVLPCIAVAMRLMDNCGRRSMLLSTSPILIASLVTLTLINTIETSPVLHAVISSFSLMTYLCVFSMGFGPVPNILCSEIFPTRVRGICIAMCSLSFWAGNILVTCSLPAMIRSVGFAGVFSLYAFFCGVAWAFVYLKVPETKGMPLEVITEFFSLGAEKTGERTEK